MQSKFTANEKHILVLLIGQIFDQIDEIAALRKQGKAANLSMQLLKEMTDVLKDLSPELQQEYLNLVLILSDKRPVPKTNVDEEFAELTSNAKRRVLTEVREKLKLASNEF